ncbi:MAG: hypothetical protein NTW07_00410 [candidate division Zixibacteria bacterium]|nr:hypothetical protein [candidate division Zixibacteria bacterium]
MVYALLVAVVLVAALLLVRLRLRVEISPERRLVFVGLGRTGPEIDFVRREIQIRLSGLRIKRFSFRDRAAKVKTARMEESPAKIEGVPTKPGRSRSVKAVLDILPQCLGALWSYLLGLLQAAIIEQAEGEIEAGFEAPHITGQVYGCYQAALAIAPTLMGRFRYTPVWTGRSFSGTLRLTVAWPVYRLVWQTVLLTWRLPIRKFVKLAIGEKKGDRHVK